MRCLMLEVLMNVQWVEVTLALLMIMWEEELWIILEEVHLTWVLPMLDMMCQRWGEWWDLRMKWQRFPWGMKVLGHSPCLLRQDALSIKVAIMGWEVGVLGLWVIPIHMNSWSESYLQKNISQGLGQQVVFPVMDSRVLLALFKQLQRKVCGRGLSSLVVSKLINQRNMMELQTGQITWSTLKL